MYLIIVVPSSLASAEIEPEIVIVKEPPMIDKSQESPKTPETNSVTWNPVCHWKSKRVDFAFANPFFPSHFTFNSTPGKQPVKYNLYGGKCDGHSTKLLSHENGKTDPKIVPINGTAYSKFCLEVLQVSGYKLPGDDVVRQEGMELKNVLFWECKRW